LSAIIIKCHYDCKASSVQRASIAAFFIGSLWQTDIIEIGRFTDFQIFEYLLHQPDWHAPVSPSEAHRMPRPLP
jgi:hypothetical protein